SIRNLQAISSCKIEKDVRLDAQRVSDMGASM
ncbi:MAG: hypothetical protein ACI9UN_001848, partial [Granulosicoccus sp.]